MDVLQTDLTDHPNRREQPRVQLIVIIKFLHVVVLLAALIDTLKMRPTDFIGFRKTVVVG